MSDLSKSFSSENSFRSHIQSKKHREREAALASGVDVLHEVGANGTAAAPGESTTVRTDNDQTMASEDEDEAEQMDEDEDYDIEEAIAASRRRMGSGDCLFCSHRSANIDENLAHMTGVHSFFIPDRDILVDLAGLLAYLGEKIAVGNLCLFCPNGGKEFGSMEAVRKHMIDKCHCKIAYETDEDRAELADYYDFMGADDTDWEDMDEDGIEVGNLEVGGWQSSIQPNLAGYCSVDGRRWPLTRPTLWACIGPQIFEGVLLPALAATY